MKMRTISWKKKRKKTRTGSRPFPGRETGLTAGAYIH
jgi:hypothetical protein